MVLKDAALFARGLDQPAETTGAACKQWMGKTPRQADKI